MHMVPSYRAGDRVFGKGLCGKDILPDKTPCGLGILSFEGIRQEDGSKPDKCFAIAGQTNNSSVQKYHFAQQAVVYRVIFKNVSDNRGKYKTK
jgi:hypothetical protein